MNGDNIFPGDHYAFSRSISLVFLEGRRFFNSRDLENSLLHLDVQKLYTKSYFSIFQSIIYSL